ncbi:MAG: hypothetical protein IPM29_25710 [Planctomycetes bacterium]|nr:hypothetical protein [Planctomycetota bacterium]
MAQRAFEFDSTIRRAAWLRQQRTCALCGVQLAELIPTDNCHHAIPDQAGDPARLPARTQEFLRSVGNAVVLCDPCHRTYAHPDGRTKLGAVPFFGHYRFSHGPRGGGAHAAWLGRLREHAAVVWPSYAPHPDDFPIDAGTARRLTRTLRQLKQEHWDRITGG